MRTVGRGKLYLLVLIVIALLAGCKTTDSLNGGPNRKEQERSGAAISIAPAKLSDETTRIIQALRLADVQVFDLAGIDEADRLTVWAESYEQGVKQESFMHFSTGSSLKRGNAQLVLSYDYDQEEASAEGTLSVTASIVDESGASSTEYQQELTAYSGRASSTLASATELAFNRPVTVIAIIEDDGNGFASYNVAYYDEIGEDDPALYDYDRVTLFRVMAEKDAAAGAE